MVNFHNFFVFEEQKEVTRGQIWGVWDVFKDCQVIFCQEKHAQYMQYGMSVVID